MEIRPARDGDVPQIADVHVRSWQGAYRGLLPQDFLDRLDPAQWVLRWRHTLAADGGPRAGVLVADDGGRLRGFAQFGPARDEGAGPVLTGEVRAIYLLPDSWGQGMGRHLMSGAVTGLTSAGYTDAILWVLRSNARARRFYQAAGWSPDGGEKADTIGGLSVTEIRYRRSLW